MNILFAAAEAVPFAKTGGLADVAASLPKALNQQGEDCRVVMPLYGSIAPRYREKMEKIAEYTVSVGWKNEYCGVFRLVHDQTTYYFLDNEYYFKRARLYGEMDDGERFIFFSKAVVRLPRVLDWPVDVMHANDWHTGLVPVYLNDFRNGDDFYRETRSLYTIHNLKYQGQFSTDLFYYTNLNGAYLSDWDLKFYDSLSFMKGAIVHATKVNTVSPTYAEEIHYPFFAEGLENVINAYSTKISGILNGIDQDLWNPETDVLLHTRFGAETLVKRRENKEALQKICGLPVRDDVPLFGMVTRLTAMKGLDLVRYILEEFLQEDVQFVVLGTGDATYEDMFRYFAAKYPKKLAARLHFSNEESHAIYGGSDVFLMPSMVEPCGLSQMIAMRYGAVPLVRETGGLRDSVSGYDPQKETGEGFTFSNINAHDLLFKMKEAAQMVKDDPDHFQLLQKNGMTKDLSWDASSRAYQTLYRSLNPYAPWAREERPGENPGSTR